MAKKIVLLLLLAVGLLASPKSGEARILPAQQQTNMNGFIDPGTTVVKASQGLVYNITLLATQSNAKVTLFDDTTGANGTPKYEAGQATSGNTTSIDFASGPLNFDKGIVAVVTNGTAFLNYQ